MTEITEAQVEAAAKAYRKHTKDIEYMGILCKCDTYCEDRADHETHRMRSALEAAQAAAPVVDVEKLVQEARAAGWEACRREVFAAPCWFDQESQTGGFDFGNDENGNAVETGAYMHLRKVLRENPYLNGGAK